MTKLVYQAIALTLVFPNFSFAQPGDLWRTFNTSDGLAGNWVNAIWESRDGALWFGTSEHGVSRYQDGRWRTFTTADGLAGYFVTAISGSNDGALWFGTAREGVSRYQDGVWTTFTKDHGLAGNAVWAIEASSDGALWFGTSEGVSRYRDGVWTTFTKDDGLAGNYVLAVIESSNGALWFGTYEGVSRYRDGVWTTFTTADGLPVNQVNAISESSDGTLWFGTSYGVSKYQGGTLTIIYSLAGDFVKAIYQSRDGALWFGTYGGVSRYRGGIWRTFTTADGLADNAVYSIFEPSDGALWFGTQNGGVSRYEEAPWTNFVSANGLALTGGIVKSSEGGLWFNTGENAVIRYQDGTWTTRSLADGPTGTNARILLESSDGALWFASDDGVSRHRDGTWTDFDTADGLSINKVSAVYESSDGALWFGHSQYGPGVSRYQNGTWTIFTTETTKNGLASDVVQTIYESSDGVLWFGHYWFGVSRYEDGIWTWINKADGLVHINVTAIGESRDGALWFGTSGSYLGGIDGGVTRYQDGISTNFTVDNTNGGLVDNNIIKVFESSDGAMWFGTFGGVSRYRDEMWTTFTTTDGLASNYVPAICETSDGAMWFGTQGEGVSRLKPDENPPITFIIRGPENLIGTSTPMFTFNGEDYRTSTDQLTYSYAVVESLIVPDGSLWSSFEPFTTIQTPPLQNGTYTFHVRARDSWGNIDPRPATRTFTIDITPPTVIITSPRNNEDAFGTIAVKGSAFDTSPKRDFLSYRLDYGKGESSSQIAEWWPVTNAIAEEIRDSTLAMWDTQGLSNGTYWLRLSADDSLGHQSQDFVTVNVVTASQIVDVRNGSRILGSSGNIEIYIPPRAVREGVLLSARRCTSGEIKGEISSEATFAGICYEITPADLQLQLHKSGTITITYPDSITGRIDEQKLAFFYSASNNGPWQRLGGSVHTNQNKIRTSFTRAGFYALFYDLTKGEGEAGIANLSIGPRVFSPYGTKYSTSADISFELGRAAHVTIKVFNTSGKQVCKITEDEWMNRGTNVVSWNGCDDSGRFCVSGMYIVVIRTETHAEKKTVLVMNE